MVFSNPVNTILPNPEVTLTGYDVHRRDNANCLVGVDFHSPPWGKTLHQIERDYLATSAGTGKPQPLWVAPTAYNHQLSPMEFLSRIHMRLQKRHSCKIVVTPALAPPITNEANSIFVPVSHRRG